MIMNFLKGFRENTTVYVFEKNGDKSYLIAIMKAIELDTILKKDYDHKIKTGTFANYINKQFYNGFTFYAKSKSKLTKAEREQVECD